MHIELQAIHKTFGTVTANDGITLDIPGSTIQGILGENGAGKSTLMKIISGFQKPDSGTILLDGSPVRIKSPADAIRFGIGMLHQDPLDFPTLSILDDFLLGAPGSPVPDRKKAIREFTGLASRLDFDLDPTARVDSLTVGERQQLEILRLLWLGAKALILDEPTTGISLPQKEKLFATLRTLASGGMTVLFVSHKLEDVESLCTTVAVLRQGALVGIAGRPFRTGELVSLMFGKEVNLAVHAKIEPGKRILSVKQVSLDNIRLQISGLDLEVRAGEVIGLAGMEGSGQALFLGACGGLMQPAKGSFCLDEDEKVMTGRTHHDFRKHGVAWLPASRMEEGLVPGMTLAEHFALAGGSKAFFVDRPRYLAVTKERIKVFNIKGKPDSPVESLSGGNQQRALLALMKDNLSLVLVEHPTRGLDIESTIYIWGKLKERCAAGTAIVFISADLDEILRYSDRVLVFFAGKVSPPLRTENLTVERLGRLIGGKDWEYISDECGLRNPDNAEATNV